MTATIDKPSAADAIRKLAAKHGSITAEIVLADAKRKTSPLHSHFQWDDSKAAREFRLLQAADLIRRIKVEYVVSDSKTVRVRAFHNVSDPSAEVDEDATGPQRGIYVSLDAALTVSSYREQLMESCRRDMRAFQQKYAALGEVRHILEAMEHIP